MTKKIIRRGKLKALPSSVDQDDQNSPKNNWKW